MYRRKMYVPINGEGRIRTNIQRKLYLTFQNEDKPQQRAGYHLLVASPFFFQIDRRIDDPNWPSYADLKENERKPKMH